MKDRVELLRKFLEETPKEKLDKIFEEVNDLPNVGPTPEEYFSYFQRPIIQDIQDDIKEWSDKTFGKDRTGLPMAHHLKKEVEEVIDAIEKFHEGRPYSKSKKSLHLLGQRRKRVKYELADCLMLLLDSAAHEQITFNDLMDAVEYKLEVNKQREWKGPDKNGDYTQISV